MALKFLNDGFFDGNVGIGTDNPIASYDRTLHVKGVNPTVKIETNSNDGDRKSVV